VGAGAGLLAVAAGGALLAWNGSRYSTWKEEDRRLRGAIDVPPATSVPRQEANDDLWRSIQRVDRGALALAAGGAVLALAGGLLWYLGSRQRPVVAASGGGLAAGVSW
jgi:hypothetical protein